MTIDTSLKPLLSGESDAPVPQQKSRGKRSRIRSININSLIYIPRSKGPSLKFLSTELLVSYAKLKNIKKRGSSELTEYIQNRYKKYSAVLVEARRVYEVIASQYRIESLKKPDKQIFSKTPFPKSFIINNLTVSILMRIVLKAVYLLSKDATKSQSVSFSLKRMNWFFLAGWDKDKNLQIVKWSGSINLSKKDPCHIATGGCSVVQCVENISTTFTEVLKVARNKDCDVGFARQSIVHETKILKRIHSKSLATAIQHPPSMLFIVSPTSSNERIIACLQRKYNFQCMASFILNGYLSILNTRQRLEIVFQIAQAVKALQNPSSEEGIHILHGDIKTENILLHQDQNEVIHAYLADFGGALDLSTSRTLESIKSLNPLGTAISRGFFTHTDRIQSEQTSDKAEWIFFQKKREIFALASTSWQILNGFRPFHSDYYESDPSEPLEAVLDTYAIENFEVQYGRNMRLTFEKCLAEDPLKRPDIDTFINAIKVKLGGR